MCSQGYNYKKEYSLSQQFSVHVHMLATVMHADYQCGDVDYQCSDVAFMTGPYM